MGDDRVLVGEYTRSDLKEAGPLRELTAEETDVDVDGGVLDFDTTADVEPLDSVIGQPRAMASLDVGLGIDQQGYNIYVSGLTGTGKTQTIRRSLQDRLKDSEVPCDWVYVNNFDEPDRPISMCLPPGKGRQLKRDMERLVERLQESLPKAFRQEDFGQEKERLGEKYQARFQQQMERLSSLARDRGFELRPGPQGQLFFIPLIDGKLPETEEELQGLPEAEQKRIQDAQKELSREAARIMDGHRHMMSELSDEVREVERRFGAYVVKPMVEALKDSYRDRQEVLDYLDRVTEHVLDDLGDFREAGRQGGGQPTGIPGLMLGQPPEPDFVEYQVNVIVDHSHSETAPIIVEEVPTYRNLFGTVDRSIDRTGRMSTNFTQIKAGAMLRASGGYLVFNLEDALTEPFVYKQLKRALKSGEIQFEPYEPWFPFSTGGLRPEPIPIKTKVIVLGSPLLYYMLRFYDQEFATIFKVRADFGTEMPRGDREQHDYARFVSLLTREEGLKPFDREAVREIIRFGARAAQQKDKLYTRFSEVADLIREANFFASRNGNGRAVQAQDVRDALQSRIFRSDRIAEKIRELINNGTLLIDTSDSKVGQVNGLAVLNFGDYAFGRPSRVTASLGLGSEGVINIEREAKLSGSTHDKGVLILAGYLRNKYGDDKPLALSASITFEQHYGGIDGDSASSTELYALLSGLAGVPLRQDIAVTGSINQWGQIQAIGGVNEKVEGFFDVCREAGLTGRQGVCIPASNVKNLLLRDDVREVIGSGRFHVYPVETVDQGMEVLSGIRAGSPDEEGTFHWLVDHRLRTMAEELRSFGPPREGARLITGPVEAPPDMPPRLPDDQPSH